MHLCFKITIFNVPELHCVENGLDAIIPKHQPCQPCIHEQSATPQYLHRFVISLRSLRNAVMNDDLIKQSMEPAALEMAKMVFVQGANWLATHPNEKAEVYDVERTKREVAVHSLASTLTKAIYGKEFTSFTSSTTISKTAHQEFFRTLCVSKVPWRASIRMFDKANTGSVSMDQMAQVFEDWNVKLTDQEKEFISAFAGGDQLIKYQALCDGIYKCVIIIFILETFISFYLINI